MATIQNTNDLLGFLWSQANSGQKNWFSFQQQKVTGIDLAYRIAIAHADKLTPDQVVDYVLLLNSTIYNKMLRANMAVTKKLGSSFAAVRDKLKFRTIHIEFDDAAFDLRVRIPLKSEMESINDRIQNPKPDHIEKIYKRFSEPLLETLKDAGDDFLKAINDGEQKIVVGKDDVMVNGTSMRQVSMMTAMFEVRVQEYFHLLQSETGEPITETYEEITSEFPEQVIKLIVEAIDKAIKPDYQNSKKKLRRSLRSQVVAAMVFNGHKLEYIDTIDEETFTEIQVMYADGIIGNRGIFDALAPLTAAVFNYFRPQNTPAFRVEQIYPWVHEYSVDPDSEPTASEKVSNSLLMFMSQAQGFDAARFNDGNR